MYCLLGTTTANQCGRNLVCCTCLKEPGSNLPTTLLTTWGSRKFTGSSPPPSRIHVPPGVLAAVRTFELPPLLGGFDLVLSYRNEHREDASSQVRQGFRVSRLLHIHVQHLNNHMQYIQQLAGPSTYTVPGDQVRWQSQKFTTV